MAQDVDIQQFLRSEGFDAQDSQRRARAVLEESGLTRPGKLRIAAEKLAGARILLRGRLLRLCGNEECDRLGRLGRESGREVVAVSATACEVCAGSNNQRAVKALAHCLRSHGVARMLVVGGMPAQHAEIQQSLASEGLQVRAVDAARGSHSRRDASPNLDWAQVLVVWGATPLPHKVSRLYTVDPPGHVRIVALAKRGVEALCREVMKSFDLGRAVTPAPGS